MLEDFIDNGGVGNESKNNHGSGTMRTFEGIHMKHPAKELSPCESSWSQAWERFCFRVGFQ